ncbi:MAG: hypothetical protein QXQ18_00840 [Candidatus Aenigmatarchaeota archaeon]
MLNLVPTLYDTKIFPDPRVSEIIEESKKKVAEYFKIPKYLLDGVKFKISKLPEFYQIGMKFVDGYLVKYIKKVGKVLGLFFPYKNEIYLDYENLYDEKLLKRTIIHELVHKAQEVFGRIYSLPRYLIEKEAYEVTNKLA